MLSKEYQDLFLRNVDEFAVSIVCKRGMSGYKDEFTLFYPIIGKDYDLQKNLLVVGQATNGWQPVFSIDDVRTSLFDLVKKSVDYSSVEEGKCALEWINDDWTKKEYSLYRSFFWNITYKLVQKVYSKNDNNWNNVIAWSNLMKIAPADGGNPDANEREAQSAYSSKLFLKELDELKPKNVLVMTNLKQWAKPVLDCAAISYEEVNGDFVEAIAVYNQSKIIITKRGYLQVTHQQAIDEVHKYLHPV